MSRSVQLDGLFKKYKISDQGAELSGGEKLNLALRRSAFNGCCKDVEVLLNSGAEINSVGVKTGNSALHQAIKENHIPMASMLLDHGADSTLLNKKRQRPLDMAALPTKRLLRAEDRSGDFLSSLSSQGHKKVASVHLWDSEERNISSEACDILECLIFQFLMYTLQRSPFDKENSIKAYIEYANVIIHLLSCEDRARFCFYSFPSEILNDGFSQYERRDVGSWWGAEYSEMLKLLHVDYQCAFRNQHNIVMSVVSHAANQCIYVPSLSLFNLILMIDYECRKEGESANEEARLCLGLWLNREILPDDIIKAQMQTPVNRLIYTCGSSDCIHGTKVHPVRAYGHDLLHVAQVYIMFRDYSCQMRYCVNTASTIRKNNIGLFNNLDDESQNTILEVLLDGYHILASTQAGMTFSNAFKSVCELIMRSFLFKQRTQQSLFKGGLLSSSTSKFIGDHLLPMIKSFDAMDSTTSNDLAPG